MFKKSIITAAVMSSIAFTAQAQNVNTAQIGEHFEYHNGVNHDVMTYITTDGQVNRASGPVGQAAHTRTVVDLVTQEELANHVGTRGQQGLKGDTGERGERGYTGFQGHTGATGAQGERGLTGATGSAGRDGIDGQDGRNGIDGKDASDSITVMQGIAGASALSFANSGGAGLGFGIATFEGQNAGAISYTHEFNNRFSASFGASSSGSAGGGFKFKF